VNVKENDMKRTLVTVALALALVASLSAQAALTKSSSLPTVDGAFNASEYQYKGTISDIKIGVTLGSDDMLYIAVEAPTSGYVGAGVGGLVMNGSRLFLGAIQDGKSAFIEKLGKGHFYTDAKDLVVKKWAVKTVGSDTVMELSLPSSAALWKGQINMIFAYSKSSSFDSHHAERGSLSFTVK
jgi:hypothetical protein